MSSRPRSLGGSAAGALGGCTACLATTTRMARGDDDAQRTSGRPGEDCCETRMIGAEVLGNISSHGLAQCAEITLHA
ncbi:hypothetical protein FKP32DRAFT_1380694 [Trametes sanguinea]|nr:hypothetical protein FKP32DRAFT_1380694 [Trametes sanguinea]